ncbi:WecB/TagA/CpsF family glycosyltransferase [Aquabacterium sp. A7-Y]|uniref:WecB/TagA/CpsF family glycosyltransferase n=1 Tax=Aquabacterium sp. A7-Y TaxID=1349605 RepID=UPI00223DDCBB|nr:WecB/TagA/CpsF family glycosyltransferase [Aquabacterium sp. A7-Y]MCW7537296.1 WecB/TagA/CpsF family glycosyltransferase [Aquabacterium sp. A7-Y]
MSMSQQGQVARRTGPVLGSPIDALSWSEAVGRLVDWGARRDSRYVCIVNVHSVVTATQDSEFRSVIDQADMSTPDGAPVAWALRHAGFSGQERINGPDLMWKYCAEAERLGQVVFFYGGTEQALEKLKQALQRAFPRLRIGGLVSPPFRALTAEEDQADVDRINAAGTAVLFVGMGCPKQEKWMAAHRGRVQAVMVGVGAAFDYHAGTIKRAPLWMQRSGLEWFYRLMSEPRRLWKRYLVTNSIFVMRMLPQVIAGRAAPRGR